MPHPGDDHNNNVVGELARVKQLITQWVVNSVISTVFLLLNK